MGVMHRNLEGEAFVGQIVHRPARSRAARSPTDALARAPAPLRARRRRWAPRCSASAQSEAAMASAPAPAARAESTTRRPLLKTVGSAAKAGRAVNDRKTTAPPGFIHQFLTLSLLGPIPVC